MGLQYIWLCWPYNWLEPLGMRENGFHSPQDKKIWQITHCSQHIISLLLKTRAKMEGRHIHHMHKKVKRTNVCNTGITGNSRFYTGSSSSQQLQLYPNCAFHLATAISTLTLWDWGRRCWGVTSKTITRMFAICSAFC